MCRGELLLIERFSTGGLFPVLLLARTRRRFRPALPWFSRLRALPLSPGAPPPAAEESPAGAAAARSPATAMQTLLLRFQVRRAMDGDVFHPRSVRPPGCRSVSPRRARVLSGWKADIEDVVALSRRPPQGPTSVKPVTSIVVTNRPSERSGKGGVWKVNGALPFGATSPANVNGSVLPGLSVPG